MGEMMKSWYVFLLIILVVFTMSYCSAPHADQGEDFQVPSKPIVCMIIDNVNLRSWHPLEGADMYRVSQYVVDGHAKLEQFETLLCKFSTGSSTEEFVVKQWWWKSVSKKERKRK
jgi:hypothetical protein